MKINKYVIYIVIILLTAILFFFGINKLHSVNNKNYNLDTLKAVNPDWRPNTIRGRDSSINFVNNKLVVVLSGPGLTDLSPIDSYNIGAVILCEVDIDNLDFLKKSTNFDGVVISIAPALKDISVLHNKRIKTLILSNVAVKDISVLKTIPLENFSLRSSEIIDISPLGNIKSLRRINLIGCKKVNNISSLAKLPALKELYLMDTMVEDLSLLDGMTLDFLSIVNTPAAKKTFTKKFKS